MKNVPHKLYAQILKLMPLLCVDAVIIREGKYLLVKRKNEPEKGSWWVPGGRVLRGETLEDAVRRKIKKELNLDIKILIPLGYYEDQWSGQEFTQAPGLHTLSIVFLVSPCSPDITLDNQSAEWKLASRLPKRFVIQPFGTLI